MNNWFKKSQQDKAKIEVIRTNVGRNPNRRKHVIKVPTVADLAKRGIIDPSEAAVIIETERQNDFNAFMRILSPTVLSRLYSKLPSGKQWKLKQVEYIISPASTDPKRTFYVDVDPVIINEIIETIKSEDIGGLSRYYDPSDLIPLSSSGEDKIFVVTFYVSILKSNLYFTYYSKFPVKPIISKMLSMGFTGGWPKEQPGKSAAKHTFKKENFSPYDILALIDMDANVDMQLSGMSEHGIVAYFDNLVLTHDESLEILRYVSALKTSNPIKDKIVESLIDRLDIEDEIVENEGDNIDDISGTI